ncbi:hypothetical protein DEU56DRAFT_739145 [Suillus clintonianus]|uniref:uncharacterized protein n=1 Tax=Suillus clintonianus TaxID=1904413 RepID=UPI001B865B12|nr:uncharacterized protein DEU56DRAFT_739282 [Suillus clintonianus]XP_041207113.1 uncharacterized protein DEU56DRAFT_739145 [Suillus clintonianus]KAG2132993.1 hypothetical protein DEU56DRAFT_739282 [Suillus clintonianus]KAG2133001.1 hypothetical protein DEU56DRAFT_739145 [Suillus clintonianus]
METVTDDQKSKYIKTENGRVPRTLNLKKEKPKNAHLPTGAQNTTFRSMFIPTVMYWVGNGSYPWTIPDNELSDVLEDIYHAVYNEPGDFEVDGCNGAFNVVSESLFQLSEWRGYFGSTAVTILMTFFVSMDEYETKEARKAYAEYQLEDSRFVYEDPDNEDSPGAFLSEFILRTFAVHLSAIQGYQKCDSLDFGLPGYATALALTTAAVSFPSPLQNLLTYHLQVERALILARDDLIEKDTSDNGRHKVMLTLNPATNKMSHTGTAFSSGNWETDTIAYMERIEELPFDRVREIVERSQPYMKRARRRGQDEDTTLGGESRIPVNPRSRIRICSICFFILHFLALTP